MKSLTQALLNECKKNKRKWLRKTLLHHFRHNILKLTEYSLNLSHPIARYWYKRNVKNDEYAMDIIQDFFVYNSVESQISDARLFCMLASEVFRVNIYYNEKLCANKALYRYDVYIDKTPSGFKERTMAFSVGSSTKEYLKLRYTKGGVCKEVGEFQAIGPHVYRLRGISQIEDAIYMIYPLQKKVFYVFCNDEMVAKSGPRQSMYPRFMLLHDKCTVWCCFADNDEDALQSMRMEAKIIKDKL